MERDINSSRKPASVHEHRAAAGRILGARKHDSGVRTRVLLILAMSMVTMGTTFVSLLAIRRPLQNLIAQNLSADLAHSLATFQSVQAQRLAALDRENALLADLPSLKALMTTNDERTIVDGGEEFWKISGNELLALADRDGNVKAAYAAGSSVDADFRTELSRFLTTPKASYLVSAHGLYGCSVQPLYFGGRSDGTLLGYVISGFAIDHNAVTNLSRATNVQAVFQSGERNIASSLGAKDEAGITAAKVGTIHGPAETFEIKVGGERFLAMSQDLSSRATAPLRLIELKSLDQEERAIQEIDHLVLLAGLLALALGAALMWMLSRFVTQPLEQLAAGVRAFASGDSVHILPYRGTREVRELSAELARMRREISVTNQALLESERLATIGRMASSVSHDLRHYLAAIYANSEFLASDKLPPSDRNEVLAEIRSAVDGTTEMLESLLMFSRTGKGMPRTQQSITALAERAMNLMRAHPDASGVKMTLRANESAETEAMVERKQVERAVYNLILNACQAPRREGVKATVLVAVTARDTDVAVDVIDNGEGVPPNIQSTLFDPFVSEGKHKGSGLGLTLTQSVAADHGGGVVLVNSHPGETVFRFSIARTSRSTESPVRSRSEVGER
jgi:signal transduction histidine kinase